MVFVDDTTGLMNEQGVDGEDEKGLKVSITGGKKQRTSIAITSCEYLGEWFQGCSKK